MKVRRDERDGKAGQRSHHKQYNNFTKPGSSSSKFFMGGKANKNEPPNEKLTSSVSNFFMSSKPSKQITDNNETGDGHQKRPFDKKQYRLKKYSRKYRLDKYEDQRKKTAEKEYYRQMKNAPPGWDVQKIYEEEDNDNENNLNSDIAENFNPAQEGRRKFRNTAQERFEQIKAEKQEKRKLIEEKRAERERKLNEYKKKKIEKFKKLSKRTKKGQPVMKDRMELLLQEIQEKLAKE